MMKEHKTTRPHQKGFTIVELLIVVVVIAILAAITIVAYNGIQNRAKMSAAQSVLTQANKKILSYYIENADMYPVSLSAAGITNTDGLEYSYNNSSTPRTYGLTSTNGAYSYYVSNTVPSPTAGGYAGHGQGGNVSITNLMTNPSFENNLSGWTPTGSISMSQTTTRKYSGLSAMMVPSRTTTTDDFLASYTTLEINTPYTISAWIYLTAEGVTANNRHLWLYNQAGGTPALDIPYPTAGEWKRISATYTPTNPQLTIRLHSVTGGVVYLDGVMITKGSTLYQYADGGSSNWIWTGTAGNSASTGPSSL